MRYLRKLLPLKAYPSESQWKFYINAEKNVPAINHEVFTPGRGEDVGFVWLEFLLFARAYSLQHKVVGNHALNLHRLSIQSRR